MPKRKRIKNWGGMSVKLSWGSYTNMVGVLNYRSSFGSIKYYELLTVGSDHLEIGSASNDRISYPYSFRSITEHNLNDIYLGNQDTMLGRSERYSIEILDDVEYECPIVSCGKYPITKDII